MFSLFGDIFHLVVYGIQKISYKRSANVTRIKSTIDTLNSIKHAEAT